jgi:hypothetical protein
MFEYSYRADALRRLEMKHSRKICVVCGREIQWRKKWRHTWQQLKYCSQACRKDGLSDIDKALEKTILTLLASRSSASSICPSEAAREYVGHRDEQKWRPLLEPARRAARRLAHRGKISILQDGKSVDPAKFKGPIRLKRIR